jgi:hypothetical protein
MSRSASQEVGVTCVSCGTAFGAEVWLIVDAAERPDLVARIVDGSIHTASCPHCGTLHPLDAPLLFHDHARQQLIFATQEHSPPEQDQQIARQLGQQLIGSIPVAERATYLTSAHIVVGNDDLRQAITGEASSAGDALSVALAALMEAGSPTEVRQLIAIHPVLGGDEAQTHLREYVEQLRDAGHDDLSAALEARIKALEAPPHPTLALIQALLDADGVDGRRAILQRRPHDVTPEVSTILAALADQAQRQRLDAVARDMLVIRDEVLGALGRDVPITPSA